MRKVNKSASVESTSTNEGTTVVETTKVAPKRVRKTKVKATKVVQTLVHANGVKTSDKRPGVLAVMTSMLHDASEKHPVTKLTILERLCESFPERASEDGRKKMLATLSMQLPAGIRTEKRIILSSSDVELADGTKAKGYWIDKKATKDAQAAHAASKAK